MCSLQEAWNDFALTNSANGNTSTEQNNMKMIREQQMQMDLQKNQSNINNERQQMDSEMNMKHFDRTPEQGYYTQSDDRRQFAQHQNDVFRPEYEEHLMTKPPTGNSHGDTIRGVHNKFSRTKRVPMMTGGNETMNLTSNVQSPGSLPNTLNDIPRYVRELGIVDGKPYREGPSNGALPAPNYEPMAHNQDSISDSFVSVDSSYFSNNSFNQLSQYNSKSHIMDNSTVVNDNQVVPLPYANNSLSNKTNTLSDDNTRKINQNNDGLEQIKMLKKQIETLNTKITMLETKVQNAENNRPHDIILIIVIALFVLFIVDNIFKLSMKF
jgi:hypothetical protein